MKVVYHISASWEVDIILREFLVSLNINIIFVDTDQLKRLHFYTPGEKYILVFSSNPLNFQEIQLIMQTLNPIITFHLSDEYGNEESVRLMDLSRNTNLLLRQHNFKCLNLEMYPNVKHIPLGYTEGFLRNRTSTFLNLKSVYERTLIWSFVGNVKADRQEMIDIFSNEYPTGFVSNNLSKSDMFNVYSNSIFVPNGRGNFSLNCFRIFEAIIAGAIPVVVGEPDEICHTFKFKSGKIPFVQAISWPLALGKCQKLLLDYSELDKLQKKCVQWWKLEMNYHQDLIRSTLENFVTQKKVAICFWGLTRSLKYTIESIREKIFKPLLEVGILFDVFMHTFTFKGNYINIFSKESCENLDFEEYKLLNPNYFMSEDQDEVKNGINFEEYHSQPDPFSWANPDHPYSTFDNFIIASYSKMKVTRMMLETNNNYDAVLFIRPDVKFHTSLDINWILDVTDTLVHTPAFGQYEGYNDRAFIGNINTGVIYGTIFERILEWSKNYSLISEKYCKLNLENFENVQIPLYFNRVRCNGVESTDY